jgi:hypothetical protein
MNNLSKFTSTRTSIVKYIVNNSNRVRLKLLLILTLVLIHYSIKNNLIINTIVVNGTLVWNTITRMVLNLYPLYRGVYGGVWVGSGNYA